MNIIYIAPMFHTNQYPIIKGWLDSGHSVSFVSHYAGKTENHKYLTPYILGYSPLFSILNWFYSLIFSKKLKYASYPEAF